MSKVLIFGENGASYSEQVTDEKMEEAFRSLEDLFEAGALEGKSFLDIGCGRDLFAIAAIRQGVHPFLSIDTDHILVKTSQENAQRWLDNAAKFPSRKLLCLMSNK